MHKRVRKSDKRSRLRRIGINTIVFLLLAMSYGCQSGEGQSEGVKPPEINQLSSNDRVYKLNHDSLSRQYLLHVPPSYINGHPIPLVINLHGGGANARMQRYSSQMNVKADQAGFMVAYPEGTGRVLFGRVFGTFNAGRCCGPANEAKHR